MRAHLRGYRIALHVSNNATDRFYQDRTHHETAIRRNTEITAERTRMRTHNQSSLAQRTSFHRDFDQNALPRAQGAPITRITSFSASINRVIASRIRTGLCLRANRMSRRSAVASVSTTSAAALRHGATPR